MVTLDMSCQPARPRKTSVKSAPSTKPAGAPRLFSAATGIDRVLVNGEEIVVGGEPTGNLPGILLTGGRDTETVLPPAFC